MALFSRAALTTIITLVLASSAFAQSTGPATTSPSKPDASKSQIVHSATSIECSKEADAKGLHGKERKKFRAECKRTSAKAK